MFFLLVHYLYFFQLNNNELKNTKLMDLVGLKPNLKVADVERKYGIF
jgi:hypothetical protein